MFSNDNFSQSFLKKIRLIDVCLAICGVILTAALVVLLIHRGLSAINVDVLYGPMFLRDLINGVPIGWSLPHSPYFFPDLIFLLPGVMLFNGFAAVYACAYVLHIFFLSAAIYCLLRIAGATRSKSGWGTWLLLVLYGLQQTWWPDQARAAAFFPTMHVNSMLAGLWVCCLWMQCLQLRAVRQVLTRFLLLFVLITLMVLSDPIILPQVVLPWLFVTVFLAVSRRVIWWRTVLFLVVSVFGWWFGRYLYGQIGAAKAFMALSTLSEGTSFEGDTIAINIRLLLKTLPSWLFQGTLSVTALLLVTGIVVYHSGALVDGWRTLRERAWQPKHCGAVIVAAGLVMTFAALVAPVSLHMISSWSRIPERYVLPFFLLPLLVLFITFFLLPAFNRPVYRRAATFAVLLTLTAVLWQGRNELSLRLDEPYPLVARAVDALAEKTGISCGLAGYGHAKMITAFSRKGVIANQLRYGYINLWINNYFWYFESGENPLRVLTHDFIVANQFSSELLREIYGQPADVALVELGQQKFVIWLYDEENSMQTVYLENALLQAGYDVKFRE